MTRQSCHRRIQRLLTPNGHFVRERVGGEIDLLVGIGAAAGALAQLDGHEPVHVRMLQREHQAAGSARAARLLPRPPPPPPPPPGSLPGNNLASPNATPRFPAPLGPANNNPLRAPHEG